MYIYQPFKLVLNHPVVYRSSSYKLTIQLDDHIEQRVLGALELVFGDAAGRRAER